VLRVRGSLTDHFLSLGFRVLFPRMRPLAFVLIATTIIDQFLATDLSIAHASADAPIQPNERLKAHARFGPQAPSESKGVQSMNLHLGGVVVPDEDDDYPDDGLNQSFGVEEDDESEEDEGHNWEQGLNLAFDRDEEDDEVEIDEDDSDQSSSDSKSTKSGNSSSDEEEKDDPESDRSEREIMLRPLRVDDADFGSVEPAWFKFHHEHSLNEDSDEGEDQDEGEDEDDEEEEDPIRSVLVANRLFNFEKEAGMRTFDHDGKKLRLDGIAGEGANGVVFKATDTLTGRTFAVKFASGDDEVGSDDIADEHRILRSLEDVGGVVKVFGDLGEMTDGDEEVVNFIVLEFLNQPFEDFSRRFDRKSLEERMKFVAGFAYYAILTLRKLHVEHEIAHCDIHGQAFMDTTEGTYRLIDFGKARSALVDPSEEPRGALSELGEWTTNENIYLLSLFELENQVCRPRDDLFRLASVLIRKWPGPYPAGERTFLMNLGALPKSKVEDYESAERITAHKKWKKDLSLRTVFGDEVESGEGTKFPRGAASGTSFIETFYGKTLQLGNNVPIPYEDILALFVARPGVEGDIGLLTPDEARAIEAVYAA
jgi:hypothetical protein